MRKLEAGWDYKRRRQDVEEIQIHNTYINEKNTKLIDELESLKEELRLERKANYELKNQKEGTEKELENRYSMLIQKQESEQKVRLRLEQELKELSIERDRVLSDANKMQKDLEWFRRELDNIKKSESEEIKNLRQDNKTLFNDNEKLRTRLKEMFNENDMHKRNLEENRRDFDVKTRDLHSNAEEHLLRHRQTQDEFIKLQEEYNIKINKEQEYLREIEEKNKMIDDLDAYRGRAAEYERQLSQQQALMNDNADLRRRVDEYDHQLQPLLAERNNLRKANDEMRYQLNQIITEKKSVESRLVKIEAESQYRERIVEKEDISKTTELNRLLDLYKTQIDDKSRMLSQLEKNNAALRQQNHDLQVRLQQLETKLRLGHEMRESRNDELVKKFQVTNEELEIENRYLREENVKLRDLLQKSEISNNMSREVITTRITQEPVRYVQKEEQEREIIVREEKVIRNSEARYKLNSPTEKVTREEVRIN